MLTINEQKDELDKLIEESSDLHKLESMLSEFNIFEAVGSIRQELRHSDFIAFLLDPAKSHGLGDLFLKNLLSQSLYDSEAPLLCTDKNNQIAIDAADLSDAVVWREWENIDILIYSKTNRWIFAIENKVDSSEHSNQLERYRETVFKEFPICQKFFIYLTKDGTSASCEAWKSLSYGTVAEVIESTRQCTTLNDDVSTLMKHYAGLVRKHIVSDSDIKKLCQKIYQEHRKALNNIYKYRLDRQLEIAEFLKNDLQDSLQTGIVLDECTKQYIRLAPKEWDALPFQKTCEKWISSQRVLIFEFCNAPNYLGLNLVIGPCNQNLKKAIFTAVQQLNIVKMKHEKTLNPETCDWICTWFLLKSSDLEENSIEELKEQIRSQWEQLLSREIKEIRQAIFKANIRQCPDVTDSSMAATLAQNIIEPI
jgi:PD-(D/E)XK nuclease superfamily